MEVIGVVRISGYSEAEAGEVSEELDLIIQRLRCGESIEQKDFSMSVEEFLRLGGNVHKILLLALLSDENCPSGIAGASLAKRSGTVTIQTGLQGLNIVLK